MDKRNTTQSYQTSPCVCISKTITKHQTDSVMSFFVLTLTWIWIPQESPQKWLIVPPFFGYTKFNASSNLSDCLIHFVTWCCNKLISYTAAYLDDVIKWKHFPRYWPFVRGIHRRPVNSPHKCQWRRVLMSSLICTWINGWVNNREASDLRRNHAHCDVNVMLSILTLSFKYGSTVNRIQPAPLRPTAITDIPGPIFTAYGTDSTRCFPWSLVLNRFGQTNFYQMRPRTNSWNDIF